MVPVGSTPTNSNQLPIDTNMVYLLLQIRVMLSGLSLMHIQQIFYSAQQSNWIGLDDNDCSRSYCLVEQQKWSDGGNAQDQDMKSEKILPRNTNTVATNKYQLAWKCTQKDVAGRATKLMDDQNN